MLTKTLQKYQLKLRNIHTEIKKINSQIKDEDKFYLESKTTLEKTIVQNTKVNSLQVNMLTYSPNMSFKDEDIDQLINQF